MDDDHPPLDVLEDHASFGNVTQWVCGERAGLVAVTAAAVVLISEA